MSDERASERTGQTIDEREHACSNTEQVDGRARSSHVCRVRAYQLEQESGDGNRRTNETRGRHDDSTEAVKEQPTDRKYELTLRGQTARLRRKRETRTAFLDKDEGRFGGLSLFLFGNRDLTLSPARSREKRSRVFFLSSRNVIVRVDERTRSATAYERPTTHGRSDKRKRRTESSNCAPSFRRPDKNTYASLAL